MDELLAVFFSYPTPRSSIVIVTGHDHPNLPLSGRSPCIRTGAIGYDKGDAFSPSPVWTIGGRRLAQGSWQHFSGEAGAIPSTPGMGPGRSRMAQRKHFFAQAAYLVSAGPIQGERGARGCCHPNLTCRHSLGCFSACEHDTVRTACKLGTLPWLTRTLLFKPQVAKEAYFCIPVHHQVPSY